MPRPDRPVAARGLARAIVFAEANGEYPAKEFFDALEDRIKKKFGVQFSKFAETGKLFNREHFKAVEGTDLFEFKVFQHRILCRHLPGQLLLLTMAA